MRPQHSRGRMNHGPWLVSRELLPDFVAPALARAQGQALVRSAPPPSRRERERERGQRDSRERGERGSQEGSAAPAERERARARAVLLCVTQRADIICCT